MLSPREPGDSDRRGKSVSVRNSWTNERPALQASGHTDIVQLQAGLCPREWRMELQRRRLKITKDLKYHKVPEINLAERAAFSA